MARNNILGIKDQPACPRHGISEWHGDYVDSGVGSFVCPVDGEVLGLGPRVRYCRLCHSLVVVRDDWTCLVCRQPIERPVSQHPVPASGR